MSARAANVLFTLILIVFAVLHRHRMAEVSLTWDEGGDLIIVDCIRATGNPFACLDDISQTRLPFLLHAAVGPAWKLGHRPHYVLSAIFSLLTLLAIYAFARRVYGNGVATIVAALYVTSMQLVASGRMLLTHSNIICTFFSTASFVTMLLFARDGRRRWLVLCALASGAAAASHPLALFNGFVLVAIYVAAKRFAWRDLAFLPLAAATFFATSVIYIKPENFRALAIACMTPGDYPHWNYFGTGSASAPWWFPLLMVVVKIGPWWLLLAAACAFRARLDRFLIAFLIGFGINLLAKGAVFHYETPHHQAPFYPVLLLAIAVLIARAWTRPVMIAFAMCLAMQIWDVARFFPHFLFYGSQYGERFIGEFYGPAVMHAQGRDPLHREILRILEEEPAAKILVADNNILNFDHPRVVPFTKRDSNERYEYAFVDRLYGAHFQFPERDAYNELLAREYRDHFTQHFPPRVWVYRILRKR